MDLTSLSFHERQEILNPIFVPQSFHFKWSHKPLSRYSIPRNQIPPDKWQEIATRKAAGDSLRQLAGIYGVSYEAIRQVLLKLKS